MPRPRTFDGDSVSSSASPVLGVAEPILLSVVFSLPEAALFDPLLEAGNELSLKSAVSTSMAPKVGHNSEFILRFWNPSSTICRMGKRSRSRDRIVAYARILDNDSNH
jgi:hypothetical protein